jgi:hypothetical protein
MATTTRKKNPAAVALAKLGARKARTPAQIAASRENGRKGGRPRQVGRGSAPNFTRRGRDR